ncbi:Rba50p SCDLUD_003823 [Saccharomycodes ludwigii]|uniref:Rba50p n=1 Tax=Saccharomycodes ludwigii TaxID=36035 RepID=UPI001E83B194|nr:hypothetical protein SCDLUD_003823 [Saccharomycodes ludwigii]KAH3899546.1 hypothetical protein SCDLUD_003823 [Saccharomycodes ludwigii]
MDLLGDVVERKSTSDTNDDSTVYSSNNNGFPELFKPNKMSSWKERLQNKRKKQNKESMTNNLTEAEKIHLENVKLMMQMSPEQLAKERKELLDSLNPKVLEKLINRIDDRKKNTKGVNNATDASTKNIPIFTEIDSIGDKHWIGGTREFPDLPKLDDAAVDKALGIVSLDTNPNEDTLQDNTANQFVNDEQDAIAPQEYQFIQQMDHMTNEELLKDVHFIKPNTDELEKTMKKLELNDPDFQDKLKELYFPDLPTEIDKLEWMKPLETKSTTTVIDNVGDIRFDFNGNLIPPQIEVKSTFDGLHHHSKKAELKGYTVEELGILSRSTMPSQRCYAIQTLGRILYKLGKQSYYELVPEVDVETFEKLGGTVEGTVTEIYSQFWDLIIMCHIISNLQEASSSKNLSVKNYAIRALWLWKKGGGDFRKKKKESSSNTITNR